MSLAHQIAFKKYDHDGSGQISREEFVELLEELGVSLKSSELEEAFDELDKDSSGDIEKNEFFRWWEGNDFGCATKTQKLLQEVAKQGRKENFIDIFMACWVGDKSIVEAFMQENNTLLNEVDENEFGSGYRPIHYAAYQGHLNILKLILENTKVNVNVNSRNEAGCTALFLAAQQGHLDCVEYLLGKGALQNIGAKGFSALDVCTDPDIRDLLEKSIDSSSLPIGFQRPPQLDCEKLGCLQVSWSYLNENNSSGTQAISGYTIRLFEQSDQGEKPIREIYVKGADEKRTDITSISSKYPVYAQIAARNIAGNGEFSKPSEPIMVCGTPNMAHNTPLVRVLSRTAVKISWNKGIPNGSAIKVYQVYGKKSSEEVDKKKWIKMGEYDFTCRNAEISGLEPGTRYTFRVTAVNELGPGSTVSSEPVKTQGGTASLQAAISKGSNQKKLRAIAAFQKKITKNALT